MCNVLMTSKTEDAYDAVLDHVCTLFDVDIVKYTMTDYEAALRNSVKKHFINAQYAGCEVHYDRVNFNKLLQSTCIYLCLIMHILIHTFFFF